MFEIGRKIYGLLSLRERKQALAVLFLTVIMAFLELIGIASVLPFIAVLSAPEKIHKNKYLSLVFDRLGFDSDRHFFLFLGVVVLSFLVISNFVKAFTKWATLRFSQMRGHTIALRLLSQYVYQSYAYFLTRNTSELRKNVGEIQGLVTNIVIPYMDLIARICVCTSIVALLLFVDPVLALSCIAILGGAYGIIYLSMRRWLLSLGQERLDAMGRKNRLTSELFLGIKNVKLVGIEDLYLRKYSSVSYALARMSGLSGMVSELPRYALEVVAFGGILFIVLYELLDNEDIRQALPMITLYALAGYRLMPNFQAAFSAMTKLRFNSAMLDHTFHEVRDSANGRPPEDTSKIEPLDFTDRIELKDISFKYESGEAPVFENLNLTIAKNSSLGVVGKTGSGKTTLVDIILGLLRPASGEILVDGVPVTNTNLRAWQRNVAYVPQFIFLLDQSIARNIAFGIPEAEIDNEQVVRVARMAALHDFIETLPEGYDTIVGENGVRLSGGQRQRIGLARALYLDRPVLVLDEATSSLDNETEREVMEAIAGIGGSKTIIMIAHRTNSLKDADKILDMAKRELVTI